MKIFKKKNKPEEKIFEGSLKELKEKAEEVIYNVLEKIETIKKTLKEIKGVDVADSKVSISTDVRGNLVIDLNVKVVLKKK